jgi:hypothetical protein
MGKILASKSRVHNYHYDLFLELNRLGHLLIIFDGLDEMKFGMTFEIFERNIERLLSLDEGRSKLLLLGRDTVFRDDMEFRRILDGTQLTAGGQQVVRFGRRQIKHLDLRGFSVDEAHYFVSNFFPIKVSEIEGRDAIVRNKKWQIQRIKEMTDGDFDDLICRPVHAQMLCEIATDAYMDLTGISQFVLYDKFVHHLLNREVEKAGALCRFYGCYQAEI